MRPISRRLSTPADHDDPAAGFPSHAEGRPGRRRPLVADRSALARARRGRHPRHIAPPRPPGGDDDPSDVAQKPAGGRPEAGYIAWRLPEQRSSRPSRLGSVRLLNPSSRLSHRSHRTTRAISFHPSVATVVSASGPRPARTTPSGAPRITAREASSAGGVSSDCQSRGGGTIENRITRPTLGVAKAVATPTIATGL